VSSKPAFPDANLLSTGGAARELGVSESLVRKLADTGRLVAVRLQNGQRAYMRASVDALKAERDGRDGHAA
jgi:hypothetical protein